MDDYANGHIPYAVNLPASAFDDGWPDDVELLLKEMTTLIYYDDATLGKFRKVESILSKYGIEKIMIMEESYQGWEAAGFDLEY